jgi:micrococcal nuclease
VRPAQGGPVRRIRLEAMDAPEICQSWGPQARQALMQRVQNRRVQVKGHAHDVYGRLVARISVDGEDVGAWMVAQGHAWSYRWHGRKGRYDAEATAARRQARGLFASASPEPPRDFRRRRGSCHPAR